MEIQQDSESFYYITAAIRRLKKYWYLFAISIMMGVGAALFLNWYLIPKYEVGSVILIGDNSSPNSTGADPSKEFMKSFSIFSAVNDIQLEVLKMKSSELVTKALEETNSEVTYYMNDGIKNIEIYNDSPFKITLLKDHPQPLDVKIQIIPQSEKQYHLISKKEEHQTQFYNFDKKRITAVSFFELNKIYNYGDTIRTDYYSFIITLDNNKLENYKKNAKFNFTINDITRLTYVYQNMIDVEQVAKDMRATSIKMKVENPQKGIDFINALTKAYLQRNVDKKNVLAGNTIKYLENQLGVIEDSLKRAENNLQSFRSVNKVMEIGAKSDQIFKGASELEDQKAELQSRITYYKNISENLEKDRSGSSLSVPSSMGINDPVLTNIIEEYIRLNSERNNLIQNKQTQSPYFNTLTIKINNQKNTLSENIKNLINSNNVLLGSVEERLRKGNAQISQLPSTQRQLVGIERNYKLNDNLYNYMLEKKAEAQVAKASNLAENDILEPAKLTKTAPVSPNKLLNLAVGLFLGLIIPFLGFGIKDFFDGTITNEHVIHSLTKLPSLGKVYHSKGRSKATNSILIDAPKSAISESIRTVRTNLDYFLEGKRNKIVLVTSTMSGEGKSFSSYNIAVSLSLIKRKTILVNFDIRKPNVYPSLKPNKDLGVSSILMGDADLDEVIVKTDMDYFDFIPAGPIPDNPAELIGSTKTETLLNELKERYDYVVIDTPPIGLVTEAFLLMKYADLKVFVVRERVTPKKQFLNVLKEMEDKEVENVYWMINDVNIKDTFYGQKNDYYTQG
ncbi:MAG: polysaccharide biosynthesis tyrosine autokinase [Bacteroidia bacterium]